MTRLLFYVLTYSLYVVTFLLTFSCSPITSNAIKNVDGESVEDAKNKIIAVVLDVHKSSVEDRDSLSLHQVNIVDGFLKRDIAPAPSRIPGKWMLSFLDVEYELIKNTIIDDPLLVDHEYLSGDGGVVQLKHVEIQREKATISVRARYSAEMKFVLVEKMDAKGNPATTGFFRIRE